jgi:drug/metabolite transporter (DMT)-like permease
MITVTRALPAITTSLATLSVPLVGYLASMAMLGEALPWNDLAGFVFILTGLVAATLDDALRHRRSRANRI